MFSHSLLTLLIIGVLAYVVLRGGGGCCCGHGSHGDHPDRGGEKNPSSPRELQQ